MMKKDILGIFALILLISVLIMGTDIQSVDEYYITLKSNLSSGLRAVNVITELPFLSSFM